MTKQAVNEQAIRKYVAVRRPDLSKSQVDGFFEHPGIMLICALCFEAGRTFQHYNQNMSVDLPVSPLDEPNLKYEVR